MIITIVIYEISDLSITMAAYFHSPATPPSSSSFLILFEITATSLMMMKMVVQVMRLLTELHKLCHPVWGQIESMVNME